MITIETPLKSVENELDNLKDLKTGPSTRMYMLGARQALLWLKDGAIPPSRVFDVFMSVPIEK